MAIIWFVCVNQERETESSDRIPNNEFCRFRNRIKRLWEREQMNRTWRKGWKKTWQDNVQGNTL